VRFHRARREAATERRGYKLKGPAVIDRRYNVTRRYSYGFPEGDTVGVALGVRFLIVIVRVGEGFGLLGVGVTRCLGIVGVGDGFGGGRVGVTCGVGVGFG
jgi:hypothetical protein